MISRSYNATTHQLHKLITSTSNDRGTDGDVHSMELQVLVGIESPTRGTEPPYFDGSNIAEPSVQVESVLVRFGVSRALSVV